MLTSVRLPTSYVHRESRCEPACERRPAARSRTQVAVTVSAPPRHVARHRHHTTLRQTDTPRDTRTLGGHPSPTPCPTVSTDMRLSAENFQSAVTSTVSAGFSSVLVPALSAVPVSWTVDATQHAAVAGLFIYFIKYSGYKYTRNAAHRPTTRIHKHYPCG